MNDDDKADLARQGIRAAELLEPGKLKDELKNSVADAVGGAALRGMAAMGRLSGAERSPARARAVQAVDIGDALASWDRADAADFERRLQKSAARKAEADAAKRKNLATLRRTFPEPARNLALLVFNCVDLLEDLSDDAEGTPASPEALARKEELLARIGALLEPNAGAALTAFVDHVVALSREHRGAD